MSPATHSIGRAATTKNNNHSNVKNNNNNNNNNNTSQSIESIIGGLALFETRLIPIRAFVQLQAPSPQRAQPSPKKSTSPIPSIGIYSYRTYIHIRITIPTRAPSVSKHTRTSLTE